MTARILSDITNLTLLNIQRRKLKEIKQMELKTQISEVKREIDSQALSLQNIQDKKAVFRNYTYRHTMKNKINKSDRLSIEGKFSTFDSKISKVNKNKQELEDKLSELKDEYSEITKQIGKHLVKSEKYSEIEKLIK